MSDPVKNHELEDVLSSIRRLVSEDGYGGSTPEKTDDIPTEVADVAIGRKRTEATLSDKLLLTEAFLVSESETAKDDEIPEATVETLVLEAAHSVESAPETAQPADVLVLNAVFDDLEAEQSKQAAPVSEVDETVLDIAQVVEETGDQGDGANQDEMSTSEDAASYEIEEQAEAENETHHASQPEEIGAEAEDDPSVEETVEGAVEDVQEQTQIVDEDADHGDDAEDAPTAFDTTETSDDMPEAEPIEEATSEVFQINPADQIDDIEDAITVDAEDDPHDFAAPSGLAHTVAELEAVISAQNDDWEPDGSEEEGASPDIEPLEWRSETTRGAKVFEIPRAETPAPMPGFQGETELDDDIDFGLEDFADDDAPLLDEAALRAMVSDIVRQELQGPLGERITRNVRKLVRREIHRILASEDFD